MCRVVRILPSRSKTGIIVVIMTVLQNISDIMHQPLGNFIYHLFLLLVLGAALGMAWGEWRRIHREEMRRLLFFTAGLLALRIVYLAGVLVTRTGGLGPESLLPPLERFVDMASVALLGWGFMSPARRGMRIWDIFYGANLVLALGALVIFAILWNQALSVDPFLSYNTYWQATIWSAWQIGLVLLFAATIVREREAGWGILLVAAVIMLAGQVMQFVYPSQTGVSQVPVWERLANLVVYSLIVVAVYRRIFAGLRAHSRQLQDVSQASLDQIKSLLYLFEAGQRMYSSLEPAAVFDGAAKGVAQALDADQCAIAVPSETDPSQMRLVAIHNPTRQGRATGASSFPLEYQLLVQQAMRRKSHVVVEGDDSVQLRSLFGLLGSNQTGPLLVQPLLADQRVMGAIIVGNAQSRRPFGPSEAKLCQYMAQQTVGAIQNSRRYRKAQEKISLMLSAQNESRRTTLRAQAQIEEIDGRLTGTQTELESLRQARDELETKLASSRAEADTLSRRLAALENDRVRRDEDWLGTGSPMLTGSAAGVLVTDGHGLIQTFNTGAETLLGLERDKLRGLALEAIVDSARWRQAVDSARGGDPVRLTLPVSDRFLLCDMAALPGPEASPLPGVPLAVILQNLSAEDEMQQTRLETVAAMAEGLTVPLSTIIGYADLLLGEAGDNAKDARRNILLRIKSGAERVVEMVQELVTEANSEPGRPARKEAEGTGAVQGDRDQGTGDPVARHQAAAVADLTSSEP